MVNSYYGIYQAERGKATAEIRAADAQLGGLAAELGQLGSGSPPGPRGTPVAAQTAVGPGRPHRIRVRAASPLTTAPRPPENGEQEVMAPMQLRDATVDGQDTTGLSLNLPCAEDPELFFAESPQDVEQAKAMCPGMPGQAGLLGRRGGAQGALGVLGRRIAAGRCDRAA